MAANGTGFHGPLAFVRSYVRFDEWFFSVVPLVLCAPVYGMLVLRRAPGADFPQNMLLFALFVSVFLAFGYLINDYSDREEDLRAGKHKAVCSVPAPLTVAALVMLALAGLFLAAVPASFSPTALALAAATYLLGASYSIPVLRLKERGVWGVVCSSFAQRGTPILVAGLLFDLPWVVIFDWVLLSFLNGLRYILVHQMMDRENDEITGTRTFARDHAVRSLRRGVDALLVIEVVLLVPSVLVPLWEVSPAAVALALFAYAIVTWLLVGVFVRVFGKRDVLYTFDLMPLEALLNVIVPCAGCLALSGFSPVYLLMAALFLLAAAPTLASKCANLRYAPAYVRGVVRRG